MSYVKSSQFNLFQVIFFSFSFFVFFLQKFLLFRRSVLFYMCRYKSKKLTPCNGRSSDSSIIIASFVMFHVVCDQNLTSSNLLCYLPNRKNKEFKIKLHAMVGIYHLLIYMDKCMAYLSKITFCVFDIKKYCLNFWHDYSTTHP